MARTHPTTLRAFGIEGLDADDASNGIWPEIAAGDFAKRRNPPLLDSVERDRLIAADFIRTQHAIFDEAKGDFVLFVKRTAKLDL